MNTPSTPPSGGRPPLNLRGNRFKPLTWETLSPSQLTMVESVMSGKRGSMQGPYNVLLRSPELGNLAQQFGAHTRYHSSLPLALNELAILLVAQFGEAGVVDVMGTMSYYTLVSMSLNVDQYPLPDGVEAELKPLQPAQPELSKGLGR